MKPPTRKTIEHGHWSWTFPLHMVIFSGDVSLPESNQLVGGLEHVFPYMYRCEYIYIYILGLSPNWLMFCFFFQRDWNHQPVFRSNEIWILLYTTINTIVVLMVVSTDYDCDEVTLEVPWYDHNHKYHKLMIIITNPQWYMIDSDSINSNIQKMMNVDL